MPSISRLASEKAMVGGRVSRHWICRRYFQHKTMQKSWLITMASAVASIILK